MKPSELAENPMPLLYELLGDQAVLLPVPLRTKACRLKGWSNLTVADTQTPAYQTTLRRGNIAVLMGNPSGGICSVDCDNAESLKQFCSANRNLRNTLITQGERGMNIWFRLTGEYPSWHPFGNGLGEWRGTGCYTLIHGIHPSGKLYRFVNKVKPLEITFDAIVWPQNFKPPGIERKSTPPTPSHSSVSPASVSESCIPESASCIPASDCIPASLHQQAFTDAFSRLSKQNEIEAREAKWFAAPENARVAPLYRDLVKRYVAGEANQRNAVIVECGKRLFYAVSPAVALQLLTAFYEINAPLFNDSLEQHQREASAMLAACEETYRATLPEIERKLYLKLPDRLRPPYRIARDLAARDEPRSPKGQFFMSADGFGRRLGVSCAEGDRILKQLISPVGAIRIVRLGEQRAAKKTPRSTEYAWLFPMGENSSPVPPVSSAEPDDDPFVSFQTAPDELEDAEAVNLDQGS